MQHYRPRICPFHELLPIVPKGASVLDVGCGSGIFLGLLHHFKHDVHGLGFDASRVAIDCATSMAQTRGGGRLRFQHIPKDQPWPGGQFDVVSMLDVLHHIPRTFQERAFKSAVERVAPGGVLLYKDMSDRPWHLAWANRAHDLVVAREWIHYVPIATVERWASEAGLQLESSGSFQMLWYMHDLRVFRRPAMP
ncbi:MAG TPA: class I SAM-dependent methyltransferase [Bryobacteraceae bacterium]|nr:class I SAM-dependent methyltransferase [Bryobacteraceae bacterium]